VRHHRFASHAWPFVGLGGLVAVICLVSIWAINRVQSDLARAIHSDAARLQAAQDLQIGLRQLRFHALMAAAEPLPERRQVLDEDRLFVQVALAAARHEAEGTDDHDLLDAIARGYEEYEAGLVAGVRADRPPLSGAGLIAWADAHPVRHVQAPCRVLADHQRERMAGSLERSEAQTRWAGRVLISLGLVGALGGVLTGYATARGLNRRAARLSVRVQAVQAQLDQEVGALTVEAAGRSGDLDARLDWVVERVREVCRRLQEQERDLLRAEQLAAVGHLAAGIAHEIRNPLTGIKFLVEAALRPHNPAPLADEDLTLIRRELVRIERTVQGLLDFARMPPPDRRPVDLRGLVSEAVVVSRGRADAKPVRLRIEPAHGPVPVEADHDQILSLLTNLLYNAIDAAPPGGEVGVRVRQEPAGGLRVEVSDTGPGIDPAVAGRLFTPFATTKPTGTGLGLTVARRVAEDHGGTLTAANHPAGGAVFTFTLPFKG
jgi:signal transduction histidine kinase